MPFPVAAAVGAGASVLNSLFHHGYDYHPGTFNYTADQNDPELALLRRRALFDNERALSGVNNDVASAGLLGSDAGFSRLAAQRNENARQLHDVDLSTFARRRLEALQLFRDQEQFKMQKALASQGQGFNLENMSLGGVGDIGAFLGQGLEEYYRNRGSGYHPNTGDPRLDALLTNASYYSPDTPARRG